MRGMVARAATFIVLGIFAGCGLATTGLEPTGDPGSDAGTSVTSNVPATTPDATAADSAPLPSNDAAVPPDDAGVVPSGGGGDSAVAADASTVPDAGGGGDACSETSDAGALATISAWPGPPPPKIDGNLSEWPCNGLVHFTSATAAYVKDPAHPLAVDLQVRWDMQNIYVAAHVVDPTVGGGDYDPVNPYNNDSVEIYVSGDATLDGDYDTVTHQYVTDYQALIVDYGPTHAGGVADTNPAHFSAAATTVSDGWDFEAALGWQAILPPMMSGFSAGTNVALDFEVNDGDGSSQVAAIVLMLAPAAASCTCVQANCCCGQTPDLPSCDSARIDRVTLQ